MVKGEPPHAQTHPMRVIFLIPKDPPPVLEGDKFSDAYKDFVAQCLQKDASARPSAKELLKHKLFKKVKKASCLLDLIDRKNQWVAVHGDDLDSAKDDNEDTGENDEDSATWDFGTVAPRGGAAAKRSSKIFNEPIVIPKDPMLEQAVVPTLCKVCILT